MILFYDEATGLIRRWIITGDGSEDVGPWVEADNTTIPARVYVWDGAVHPLPPQPDPWLTFDPAACAWVDMRGPEQVAADLTVAKAAAIAEVNNWAARQRGGLHHRLAGAGHALSAQGSRSESMGRRS